jgi:hypothetical protein
MQHAGWHGNLRGNYDLPAAGADRRPGSRSARYLRRVEYGLVVYRRQSRAMDGLHITGSRRVGSDRRRIDCCPPVLRLADIGDGVPESCRGFVPLHCHLSLTPRCMAVRASRHRAMDRPRWILARLVPDQSARIAFVSRCRRLISETAHLPLPGIVDALQRRTLLTESRLVPALTAARGTRLWTSNRLLCSSAPRLLYFLAACPAELKQRISDAWYSERPILGTILPRRIPWSQTGHTTEMIAACS